MRPKRLLSGAYKKKCEIYIPMPFRAVPVRFSIIALSKMAKITHAKGRTTMFPMCVRAISSDAAGRLSKQKLKSKFEWCCGETCEKQATPAWCTKAAFCAQPAAVSGLSTNSFKNNTFCLDPLHSDSDLS